MVGAVLLVPRASLVATHAPGSITHHYALSLVLQFKLVCAGVACVAVAASADAAAASASAAVTSYIKVLHAARVA